MGESDLIEDETSLAYRLSNLRKDHDLKLNAIIYTAIITASIVTCSTISVVKNPNISIVIDAARFFSCFY